MSKINTQAILDCPMVENDADAATLKEYLGLLLSTLWLQGDDFSSKRPFGNSDWQWKVYESLAKEELVLATFDEDGYIDEIDVYYVDELILQAIRTFYKGA
jgi:hypothetical protein